MRPVFVLVCCLVALLGAEVNAEGNERTAELTEAAMAVRSRLDFDGKDFTGPALDRLLAEARGAQFFLIGEEHGIAENPKLVAQLFAALVADGYEKLVIEISPPMADILDEATRSNGIDGLRHLYALPGGEPAFFGMREEAELLAAARAARPDAADVFWGVDYEVASDRPLLRQLQEMQRPASSDQPLAALLDSSNAAWARYQDTGKPQFIFSFSGDPSLVTAVSDAWPNPDDKAVQILETLQSTLEINQLWIQGRGWDSNARRAATLRANFLRHWQGAKQNGSSPKVVVKLGANHIVRGKNMTGTYDLGTLLPEVAAVDGGRSFSILVLPGAGSTVAVLNPSSWSYESKPAKDNYAKGIETLTSVAHEDAFTLIDLAALRPMVGSSTDKYGAEVARLVHGFDMLLVMSGSTASSELDHD